MVHQSVDLSVLSVVLNAPNRLLKLPIHRPFSKTAHHYLLIPYHYKLILYESCDSGYRLKSVYFIPLVCTRFSGNIHSAISTLLQGNSDTVNVREDAG